MKYAAVVVGLAFVVACGSEAGTPSSGKETPASDSSGSDPSVAADTPSANPDAPAAPAAQRGEPLPTAENEKWTWVDVPGTACANGSPTGVGVNYTNASTDVVVFLEGGGACWDGGTCYGGKSIATYLTGYGKLEFDTDPQRLALFPTKRDADNPLNGMNMVYVPYCTGDVHAGNNVVTYSSMGIKHETHHVGAANLALVFSRVAATFPNAKNVWIAGDSAGGFGAALSVPLAKEAFPTAKLGILDDSGQPVAPKEGRWKIWQDAWKLALPAGCTGCTEDPAAILPFYKTQYPDVTFALLSYSPDPVISLFMGISQDTFAKELTATLTAFDDAPGGKVHYFIAKGASHVVFQKGTPELAMWIQQALEGSPNWANKTPKAN